MSSITLSVAPELPGGISGVAKLVECNVRYSNNDREWWFFARGEVQEPKEYKGYSTFIMEPLFETPERSRKSLEDHVSFMLNEIRKLGGDTNGMDLSDIQHLLATLQESRVHFRFYTGEKKGVVSHTWQGAVEKEEADVPIIVTGK